MHNEVHSHKFACISHEEFLEIGRLLTCDNSNLIEFMNSINWLDELSELPAYATIEWFMTEANIDMLSKKFIAIHWPSNAWRILEKHGINLGMLICDVKHAREIQNYFRTWGSKRIVDSITNCFGVTKTEEIEEVERSCRIIKLICSEIKKNNDMHGIQFKIPALKS